MFVLQKSNNWSFEGMSEKTMCSIQKVKVVIRYDIALIIITELIHGFKAT